MYFSVLQCYSQKWTFGNLNISLEIIAQFQVEHFHLMITLHWMSLQADPCFTVSPILSLLSSAASPQLEVIVYWHSLGTDVINLFILFWRLCCEQKSVFYCLSFTSRLESYEIWPWTVVADRLMRNELQPTRFSWEYAICLFLTWFRSSCFSYEVCFCSATRLRNPDQTVKKWFFFSLSTTLYSCL